VHQAGVRSHVLWRADAGRRFDVAPVFDLGGSEFLGGEDFMVPASTAPHQTKTAQDGKHEMTRAKLIDALNADLAREYQAIIAYVVYSQVLKGAAYMKIASELELHAKQELEHALIVAKQIDYLGGTPTVEPIPVKMSDDPKELLRFDLDNEIETIRNYRQRVTQCEELGEFAIAELVRKLLVEEQDHEIDLATALGIDPPDPSAR
jgi:bacterioferritin